MDLRSITLVPKTTLGTQHRPLEMVLDVGEPNFTVGQSYEILSLVVDCDVALPKPRPYAVCFDDDGHLKLVDLGKLRRPGS